ncbi:protein adenylyltransferase SelO [Microbacterium aurantiacum]|uniref:Protein nucleotidyltransferase YdiU n=2 Tax=Microbacterium aurantiacum TaxID=162393 RepID=A0AAJ2LUP6_9MICO|nr:YdiU family protein [Microbacterium aurantiacum]MDS0244360.1 YdiU family protein [Microbacterium aurantiacum]
MTPTARTAPATLTHRFADAVPEMAVAWRADVPPAPALLVLDDALATELGLDPAFLRTPAGLGFLTGTALPDGAQPVAQAYAGHQFGGYNPRLGDGRALLLGELTARDGATHDLHLKGSGPTPFARGGDGFAAVGPMLREYVVSEAMHALGIPTTRALAVVATGRDVVREQILPGAVLVRTASSHLRVGSVVFANATGDRDVLERLVDHAIERHDPGIDPETAAATPTDRARALLDVVIARQADLIARWMLVGFVHGVMNTDNMTLSGETIDYGPCAFLDAFDPGAVFSSIDRQGRYAYGNQPGVGEWNLARLAEALLPLLADDTDAAISVAQDALDAYRPAYNAAWSAGIRAKLGLGAAHEGRDEDAVPSLVSDLFDLLAFARADYTLFFRHLATAARGDTDPLRDLVADPGPLDLWLARWLALAPDPEAMDRVNPLYIPRNHLVEEALAAASDTGDLTLLHRLTDAVRSPFTERLGLERYAEPAPDAFGPYVTYCGT